VSACAARSWATSALSPAMRARREGSSEEGRLAAIAIRIAMAATAHPPEIQRDFMSLLFGTDDRTVAYNEVPGGRRPVRDEEVVRRVSLLFYRRDRRRALIVRNHDGEDAEVNVAVSRRVVGIQDRHDDQVHAAVSRSTALGTKPEIRAVPLRVGGEVAARGPHVVLVAVDGDGRFMRGARILVNVDVKADVHQLVIG